MCGICGIITFQDKPLPREAVNRMNAAMYHRGPDEGGCFFQGNDVGLAMRRLSIIDREGGHQPLTNEEQTVWLVMNGEIYNHGELRHQLQSLGHRFATASDAEVVVHLYEEYGKRCVTHLRGMFAFALYDIERQVLLLGRDRSGQKPLYYTTTADQLIFASESKALWASSLVEKQLDPIALDSYLSHGFVPGVRTLFQGVNKLPAGSVLKVEAGEIEIEPYWDLPRYTDSLVSEEEAVLQVRKLIEESVSIRLMSEVPLGAFLSGGVDSSAVVGLMARQLSSPVKTFSIGFGDRRVDELDYARQVAHYFGTDHHEHVITGCPPDLLEKINWHHDEPAADPAIVPTFLLSQFAKQFVTVVLTGEGGDEIFGGYHHYKAYQKLLAFERRFPPVRAVARLLERGARLPLPVGNRRLWKGLWIAGLPREERSRGWLSVFTDHEKQRLCRPEFHDLVRDEPAHADFYAYQDGVRELDYLTQSMYIDSKLQLAEQLLMKVDKASMAFSLEARCPLLDHQLIEYVGALPTEMKISGAGSKLILKKALSDLLPMDILTRRKQGFEVPLDKWLQGELSDCVQDMLLRPQAPVFNYLDSRFVQSLWRDFAERHDRQAARQVWLLLNLAMWYDGLARP